MIEAAKLGRGGAYVSAHVTIRAFDLDDIGVRRAGFGAGAWWPRRAFADVHTGNWSVRTGDYDRDPIGGTGAAVSGYFAAERYRRRHAIVSHGPARAVVRWYSGCPGARR